MNTQTQTLQSAPAPQRPWRRKSKNDVLIVVVASIAPGLIAFTANALDILSGFLAGVLFIILQISAGAAAGVIHRGRRGLSDGVLISAIGFAISFVAIMMS